MASRGDRTKLDILSGDLKSKGSQGQQDFYAGMPDFFTFYSFGKAQDADYDGWFTMVYTHVVTALLKSLSALL